MERGDGCLITVRKRRREGVWNPQRSGPTASVSVSHRGGCLSREAGIPRGSRHHEYLERERKLKDRLPCSTEDLADITDISEIALTHRVV